MLNCVQVVPYFFTSGLDLLLPLPLALLPDRPFHKFVVSHDVPELHKIR